MGPETNPRAGRKPFAPIIKEASQKDVTTLPGAMKSLAGQAASGAWNLGSKMVTGIANATTDTRTQAEKQSDAVDAAKYYVEGNIGSSKGSARAGVPTPSGTAPMVSFNFGGNAGAKEQASAPAPVAPAVKAPVVTPPSKKPAPTGGRGMVYKNVDGPTPGEGLPSWATMGPEQVKQPDMSGDGTTMSDQTAGYGMYADGSPITLEGDRSKMPGQGNTGLMDNGSKLGVIYGPGEQAAIEESENRRLAEVAARDNEFRQQQAMAPRDMSPGSQGAWEKQYAQELSTPDVSKMSAPEYFNYRRARKTIGENSVNAMHDATAQNYKDVNAIAREKLPFEKQLSSMQAANYGSEINERNKMLPGKVRNQDITGEHTIASTGNLQADTAIKKFMNSPQMQGLTIQEKKAEIERIGRANRLSEMSMEKLRLDIDNYQTKAEIAAAHDSTLRENRRVAIAGNPSIPIEQIADRVEAVSHDPRTEELVTTSPAEPARKEGGFPFTHWGGTKVPKKEATKEWRPKQGMAPAAVSAPAGAPKGATHMKQDENGNIRYRMADGKEITVRRQ